MLVLPVPAEWPGHLLHLIVPQAPPTTARNAATPEYLPESGGAEMGLGGAPKRCSCAWQCLTGWVLHFRRVYKRPPREGDSRSDTPPSARASRVPGSEPEGERAPSSTDRAQHPVIRRRLGSATAHDVTPPRRNLGEDPQLPAACPLPRQTAKCSE